MDFNPAAALRFESDILAGDRRGGRSKGATDPRAGIPAARFGCTQCKHESEDAKRMRALSIARQRSGDFFDGEQSMLS